jgi:hypothetical protein
MRTAQPGVLRGCIPCVVRRRNSRGMDTGYDECLLGMGDLLVETGIALTF